MTVLGQPRGTDPHEVWVLLYPNDVVTFRDGRPFTTGVAATGRTTLPRPSSTAGAIGALFGRRPLRLAGPVLVRTGGARQRMSLPVPADIVVDDGQPARLRPTSPDRVEGHGPGQLPAGVRTDLDADRPAPAQLIIGDGDPVDGVVDSVALAAYLSGDEGPVLHECADGGPAVALVRETRLGIARHPRSAAGGPGRTTVPGFLYQEEFLRPVHDAVDGRQGDTAGLAFAMKVVFEGPVPEPRTGLIRLGGEARQAEVRVLAAGDPAVPVLPAALPAVGTGTGATDRQVLLYLATPAIFVDGWRPKLPAGCELVAACTTGPDVVAGISGDTGRGRPLRWAVGAGSVYYLRFGDASAAARFAEDAHGECLEQAEDWMRTAGFGLCLVGRW